MRGPTSSGGTGPSADMSGNGTLDQQIISLNDIHKLQKQAGNENKNKHERRNVVSMSHSEAVHSCLALCPVNNHGPHEDLIGG